MLGNIKESINSDCESEDEITSEKINNEELFISSMLEATEDDIAPEDDWGPNPRKLRIHVKEGSPETLREKFEKLIPLIQEVSATCYRELTGCTIKEFEIKLTMNKVIYVQPYRRSPKELAAMKKVTDELLETGIITLSDSEY